MKYAVYQRLGTERQNNILRSTFDSQSEEFFEEQVLSEENAQQEVISSAYNVEKNIINLTAYTSRRELPSDIASL